MKLEIAKGLIENGLVKLAPNNPFTYASGLRGPIYCDNRLILSHVNFREKIIQAFLGLIQEKNLTYDLIGGVATAGIPYAAFIADRKKQPMIYIRGKAKDHGKKNRVEGLYSKNQSVVLIEDLVNQASSLYEAKMALTEVGLKSSLCLSIVDYQMEEAAKRLKNLELTLYSLTDFEHLVKAALELNLINPDEKKLLDDWKVDPARWSNEFKTIS